MMLSAPLAHLDAERGRSVKVLQLLSNPEIGGTEMFLLSLIPLLRERGLDVRMANLLAGGGAIRSQAIERDIPFRCFDVWKGGPRPHGTWAFWKYLREERFDVINAYGIRTSMFLRLLGGLRQRTVRVVGLRGIDAWRKWYHVWPERLTQWRVDWFVGNSQSVCDIRRKREWTADEKLTCIPNGIDPDYFSPDRVPYVDRTALKLPSGLLCITVASFRHQKGHPYLLDVLHEMGPMDRPVHFVWVGKGPDQQELKEKAEQLGVRDKITFYGDVDDVRPLLCVSDLFILPSFEEGMPRALMEAMSMGLPALATRVGGVPEVLEDGKTGFLVDHGDVDRGVAKLRELLNDGSLRQRMGREARNAIRERFSLDTMAHRFWEFYVRIAQEKV